jgi:hypothetical protein
MARPVVFLSGVFVWAAILFVESASEEKQPKRAVETGLDFSIFDDAPENEKGAKLTPEAKTAFKEIFFIHELSDPKRLEFEGVKLFPEKQLRIALALDLKYQVAARPSNRTGDFLDTLEKRLREGYLRSGCPDAVVAAMRDGRREAVVVRVDEGPRFRMGKIRVTGNTHVDSAPLIARLTETQQPRTWRYRRGDALIRTMSDEAGQDDKHAAYWEAGELVDFRDDPKLKFAEGVRLALDDFGYAAASFHVELLREPEKELMHAQITILDELLPTTIGRIEATGLKRDSEKALLDYVKIGPGDRVDADVLQRISDRLTDSCRYWTHDIEVVIEPGDDPSRTSRSSVVLRLNLEEYAAVPPIDEPLSATDEVLRKTAKWIKSAAADSESPDLICTLAGANLGGAAHAARVGLAADGTIAIEARRESARGLALDHTFIARAGGAEIYDWKFEEKFCDEDDWHPLVQLVITAEHDSDRKQKARMTWGYTLGGSNDAQGSTKTSRPIRVDPVALLRLAHLPGSKVELNSGVLSLEQEGLELKIDEVTGQLRSIEAATFPMFGVSTIYLETRKGAVEEMVERARNRAADFPNRCDPDSFITSLLSFGLEQCERQPAIQRDSARLGFCRAARQLVESRELREALAEMHSDAADKDEDGDGSKFRMADGPVNEGSGWTAKVLPYVPAAADAAFPHGSMPWTIVREYCFWHHANGEADQSFDEFRKHAAREFDRLLLRENLGPVGHLLLARALRTVFYRSSNKNSAMAAERGLAALTDVAIANDVELLTEGDHGLAVACRAATELLGKMSRDDQRQLLELVPEEFRRTIRQLIDRRSERPEEPAADAMKLVLMETWHSGLRDAVEAELRRMSVQIAEKPEADEPVAK